MKRIKRRKQKGAALLIVLFIVMAVTILSLGFLSRSDVELACGENMILRTQMDYLAESGLEHAKGLILNPQDVSSEYWQGGVGQQLYSGDDYYDVNVTRRDPCDGPTYRCNYEITSEAYRNRNGEKIGRSALRAELRLDPCIALWTGRDTAVTGAVIVNGDVYCNGTLTSEAVINGDVFAGVLSGSIAGQYKAVGDLLLQWPRVTIGDFTSHYNVETISTGSLDGETLGSCSPVRVCYRMGDLVLAGNVQINGMLVVDGHLIIRGDGNVITAGKNVPALLVTRDLVIEDGGGLNVDGLVVVDEDMQISAGSDNVSVLGGLFVTGRLAETTANSSGSNDAVIYGDPIWHPSGGQIDGALEFDGVNDKVEEAGADSYLNGLSAITVSLWVKSDVTGQDRGILFTSEPIGGADEDLGIRYDASGAFGGGVAVIKASIRTTWGYTQIESTSGVQTTGWQHLALVWESGSSIKLYINGQLNPLTYDRGAVSGTVSGVQKLMLGRGTKGKYWDGLIDDVRIYNRALDVNDIYPTPSEVGLVGHWKLDEEGTSDISITAAPSKAAIVIWSEAGVAEKWGQAAGAFFRSIERR